MLARLASLRVQLLLAMVVTAIAGLVGAYLLVASLRHRGEQAVDREKAAQVAGAIAAVGPTATPAQLALVQRGLRHDRILVHRGGRLLFAGPAIAAPLELTATARFPGGDVVFEDYEAPSAAGVTPLQVTGIAAAAVALVIGVAFLVATFLVRAVRRPVELATAAARRVAAGDLSARMGEVSEDEFAELGRTFDDMASRLEQADRDQRRFLADVAHEIATPMNAIRGFATALADGTIASDAARGEALQLIEAQGERLDDLLAALRRLTRLELVEAVRLEEVDLGALCADVVARFGPAAADADVRLRLDPRAPGRLVVESDRLLLETVIDNLVSNAIRYTPAGGSVELSARDGRTETTVAVRDTGIGIAPEHRQRIFDRLYRVDEARDRASGGSGLGLAIAQRSARALGGRIEVDSEPGVGSEFRLVLPRQFAAPS